MRTDQALQQRFEDELLKVRLKIVGLVQRVVIHVCFVGAFPTLQKLMQGPVDAASLMPAVGPVLAYVVHALFQAGILEIKTRARFAAWNLPLRARMRRMLYISATWAP